MNTRAKGNRNEARAVTALENNGWLTYRVKGSTIWNKNVDIFGLFDIIAIKRLNGITYTRYIQVKSNQKPSMKPFKLFKDAYGDERIAVEIWVYVDRKQDGDVYVM